jgi:hypothetical protein
VVIFLQRYDKLVEFNERVFDLKFAMHYRDVEVELTKAA